MSDLVVFWRSRRPRCSSAGPSLSASTRTGCGSAKSATSRSSSRCCGARGRCSAVAFVVGHRLAGRSICTSRWTRSATCVRSSRRAKASRSRCRAGSSSARSPAAWRMLVAAIIGLFVAGQWEDWLTWRNAVPFGVADPILGHDVGFYVFSLPFLQIVRRLRPGAGRPGGAGLGRVYLVSGSLTSGFPARLSMTPVGAPASVAARRGVLCSCWHGARGCTRAEYLVRAVGADPRRELCRRLRPHAGGAVADGGRCRRRGAGACCTAFGDAELADSRRGRPLYRRVDRRRGLQLRPAALRRHAERAGARDAVHRAQHRRDAAGVRARRASRSASCPAMRCSRATTSRATRRRSRTSGSGITSRCSRRSGRSRRSAPTTTSSRSTTTATASTARCGR